MKLAASQRGQSITRRLGAVAIIGASLLGVSACGYIAPQQTTQIYSASDGIRLDLGNIELRNILIVTSGTDKPGRILGAVFNTADKPIQVNFRGSDGAQSQVTVEPGTPYYLNESNDASILSSVSEPAGGLEAVTITQNGVKGPGSGEAKVPVLDGTLEEYKAYVPKQAPAGGTPTPSTEPTP